MHLPELSFYLKPGKLARGCDGLGVLSVYVVGHLGGQCGKEPIDLALLIPRPPGERGPSGKFCTYPVTRKRPAICRAV